jgi:phosphoenolpyruvate synthase/pyruvate phosphate dikinase
MPATSATTISPRRDAGPELLWLGDDRAGDPALCGGKAASLSRLAHGFPVPPGFVLSLPAGDCLGRRADELLAGAYGRLAALAAEDRPAVAVRSSAADEDGADRSFAGQHDTFLNVRGAEQLYWAASRCVASFAAERARRYRAAGGLAVAPARVAVLVQRMVAADVAAVVFSANPVTGARDEIVVNASWGLGESVVAGTVTPDTYVLDARRLTVRSRDVADKRRMTVAVPAGTREVPVPTRLAQIPVLRHAELREAAAMAVALERCLGRPVDLELAWAGGDVALLQCRPVTSLPRSTQ